MSPRALGDVGEAARALRRRARFAHPRERLESAVDVTGGERLVGRDRGELEARGGGPQTDTRQLERLLVPAYVGEHAGEADVRRDVARVRVDRLAIVRLREHVAACAGVRVGGADVTLARRGHLGPGPRRRAEQGEEDDVAEGAHRVSGR